MKLNKQNNNIFISVFICLESVAKTCIHLKRSGKSSKNFLLTEYFGGCTIRQFDSSIVLLVVVHETGETVFGSLTVISHSNP